MQAIPEILAEKFLTDYVYLKQWRAARRYEMAIRTHIIDGVGRVLADMQRGWCRGLRMICDELCHADGSVTAIYNRYGYVKEMREVLERWAEDLIGEEYDAASSFHEPETVPYVIVDEMELA